MSKKRFWFYYNFFYPVLIFKMVATLCLREQISHDMCLELHKVSVYFKYTFAIYSPMHLYIHTVI